MPSFAAPVRPQGDVRVAAQTSLFHVAIADAEVFENLFEGGEVGVGLGRAAQVGLAHDLHERRAAPVHVEQRVRILVVDQFTGILFEMNARDADSFLLPVDNDGKTAPQADRHIVLRDLVPLGKIRVEVVLAGEDRLRSNGTADGEPHAHGHAHRFTVEHGKRSGKPETDRAAVGIRRIAERGGAAAEHLGFRQKLGVNFEADDRFKFHSQAPGYAFLFEPPPALSG